MPNYIIRERTTGLYWNCEGERHPEDTWVADINQASVFSEADMKQSIEWSGTDENEHEWVESDRAVTVEKL